jgi:hypothetical protein
LDDRPPEEQAGEKKRAMLDLVPSRCAQRQLVRPGEMPDEQRRRERDSTRERMSE